MSSIISESTEMNYISKIQIMVSVVLEKPPFFCREKMVSTIDWMRTTGAEGGMKVTGDEMTGEHCCQAFESLIISD